jgi:hypothetical protein
MWYFYKNNWYLKKGGKFYPATYTSNCFGIITKAPVEDHIAGLIKAYGEEREPAWRDR